MVNHLTTKSVNKGPFLIWLCIHLSSFLTGLNIRRNYIFAMSQVFQNLFSRIFLLYKNIYFKICSLWSHMEQIVNFVFGKCLATNIESCLWSNSHKLSSLCMFKCLMLTKGSTCRLSSRRNVPNEVRARHKGSLMVRGRQGGVGFNQVQYTCSPCKLEFNSGKQSRKDDGKEQDY